MTSICFLVYLPLIRFYLPASKITPSASIPFEAAFHISIPPYPLTWVCFLHSTFQYLKLTCLFITLHVYVSPHSFCCYDSQLHTIDRRTCVPQVFRTYYVQDRWIVDECRWLRESVGRWKNWEEIQKSLKFKTYAIISENLLQWTEMWLCLISITGDHVGSKIHRLQQLEGARASGKDGYWWV